MMKKGLGTDNRGKGNALFFVFIRHDLWNNEKSRELTIGKGQVANGVRNTHVHRTTFFPLVFFILLRWGRANAGTKHDRSVSGPDIMQKNFDLSLPTPQPD